MLAVFLFNAVIESSVFFYVCAYGLSNLLTAFISHGSASISAIMARILRNQSGIRGRDPAQKRDQTDDGDFRLETLISRNVWRFKFRQ